MSFKLAITDISSIFMTSADSLGQEIMNKRFAGLLENDIRINQLFSNNVGIWTCSWYYDNSIKGYSLGDAVWLNTEDRIEFLKNHVGTIKEYTDLNSNILTKLPDFNQYDDSVIEEYQNALSGYTDINIGKGNTLPPIFDIGDLSKPIQLLVSLKNNNKDLLSETSSWYRVFIDTEDDEAMIRNIIAAKEKIAEEEHLIKYHLSGSEEAVEKYLSNYLDVPSTTPTYTTLSSFFYNTYSETDYRHKHYGVDYVRYSIRKPYILSGNVSQYQMVRYWKSGMIEHFGTLATSNEMFHSSAKTEFVVPFNWQIANDDSGAKAYIKGELGQTANTLLWIIENAKYMIPPKDNYINMMIEKQTVEVDGSPLAKPFKNTDYSLTIHPVYQTQNGLDDNYLPIDYGEEGFEQLWNSNYLTIEALNKKTNYFTMRLDTRTLPPYISYYAVGQGY